MIVTEEEHLVRAQRLLWADETDVPDAVKLTARFLARHGMWFQLSRNGRALSCRDAAHKRQRLGHTGIPLWDEMKSFFGKVEVAGETRHLMAHCRGDRLLDFQRLAAAVGSSEPPQRLTKSDLTDIGLRYGLVNPFATWEPYALDGPFLQVPVLQVFDEDLLTPLGTPGTVMTNAGALTWGVEFRAADLASALIQREASHSTPLALRSEISESDPAAPRPPYLRGKRSIAIITGNAPESGISLWQRINADVRDLLGSQNTGDSSMPPVHVISLPELGMTMELDRRADHVWAKLEPVVRRLCETDTAILAIACNTTQYYVDPIREICDPAGVQFVSLPEVVASWLHASKVDNVALVGIPYVANLDAGWSAYADPLNPFVVEDLDPQTFDALTELAYRVKEEGPTEGGLARLRSILSRGVQSSHVILALTELSVLLELQRKPGRSGKTMVDPVALYAECLARQWLGLPFPARPKWTAQLTGLTHHGGRTSTDGLQPWNEDGVLLGTRLVPVKQSGTTPAIHQEILNVEDGALVAVADGLSSHAAGEQASRFVLARLRDAAGHLSDSETTRAFLEQTSRALHDEAQRSGDPVGEGRAATAAGLSFATQRGGSGDFVATWFSIGDCVIARLDRDSNGHASVTLLCEPDCVDGDPNRALGWTPFSVSSDATRIEEDSLFLCFTDGFPTSFGLDVDDPRLGHKLSAHPQLQPIWEALLCSGGNPDTDRKVLGFAFEEVLKAWTRLGPSTIADNVSVALARVHRP